MAGRNEPTEPAFAWAALMMVQGVLFYIFEDATSRFGWHSGVGSIDVAIYAAGALSFVIGLCTGAAMAAPQPRESADGAYPLWLRATWRVLGCLPPPLRWVRIAVAVPVSAFLLAPAEPGLGTLGVSSLSLALAAGIRKPDSVLEMSGQESVYLATSGLLYLWFTVAAFSSEGRDAWLSAAGFVPLILLQGQRAREITALRWLELAPGLKPPPALDLSRYQLSVAHAAVAPPAPGDFKDGAQLVGEGSFSVDMSKMLGKLRERQLRDPRDFMSAWLRCAAASGAENIALTSVRGGLKLSFDGRAFSAAELAQPYQALVEGDGADALRGRHFAYGLLALYRLKPRRLVVTSRGRTGVATMSLRPGRGAGTAAPAVPTAPPGTSVLVEWPFWTAWWRPFGVLKRARSNFGCGPAALTVDGTPVPGLPGREQRGWRGLPKVDGWRGGLRESPGGGESLVRLYCLGAFVEEIRTEGFKRGTAVEAWLGRDDLPLDISQSSVVRGPLLERGLGLLRRAALEDPA